MVKKSQAAANPPSLAQIFKDINWAIGEASTLAGTYNPADASDFREAIADAKNGVKILKKLTKGLDNQIHVSKDPKVHKIPVQLPLPDTSQADAGHILSLVKSWAEIQANIKVLSQKKRLSPFEANRALQLQRDAANCWELLLKAVGRFVKVS